MQVPKVSPTTAPTVVRCVLKGSVLILVRPRCSRCLRGEIKVRKPFHQGGTENTAAAVESEINTLSREGNVGIDGPLQL